MFAARLVDDVGRETAAVVQDETTEEGGAARDAQVRPVERVLGHVVAHGEGEVLQQGDFLYLGGAVVAGGDLGLQVVADAHADAAGPSVGRAAVKALLEDGVAVHIARGVGVLFPVAEPAVAEVGMVGERHRGVDDVADGLQEGYLEVELAVDARRQGGGVVEVAVGGKVADGVDGHVVGDAVVVLLDGRPVPALVVGDGVGPVEVFQHFDGAGDGYGVLDAVLHLVACGCGEEGGVAGGDVVLRAEGVRHGDVLIPFVRPYHVLASEGVEADAVDRQGGQLQVDETRLHVVRFAGGQGQVERFAQLRGERDTRRGGRGEVVAAVGGVAVVVAALQVDVGRETAVGVGFGVLVVLPRYLEVAVFVVGVGVALQTLLGDAVAHIDVALVAVAPVVVGFGLGGPAEVGVDVAQQQQVYLVVERQVVAAVFEVVAATVHPAVGGDDDARRPLVRDGEEGEGDGDGGGHVGQRQVGGTGEQLVARDDFRFGEVDGEVRVTVVAGGVESAAEEHDGVVHLLDAAAVQIALALLGDDARDDAFLVVVVEDDGVGQIFRLTLDKEGLAADAAVAVGRAGGGEPCRLEVHLHRVGFQRHVLIFDRPLAVEVGAAHQDVQLDGVFGLVVHHILQRVGRDGHGGGHGVDMHRRVDAGGTVVGVAQAVEHTAPLDDAVYLVQKAVGRMQGAVGYRLGRQRWQQQQEPDTEQPTAFLQLPVLQLFLRRSPLCLFCKELAKHG